MPGCACQPNALRPRDIRPPLHGFARVRRRRAIDRSAGTHAFRRALRLPRRARCWCSRRPRSPMRCRSTATSKTATNVALPYEPHELIVGYRGTASALLREIRRDAHIVAAVSTRPELTPDEQLLTLSPGVQPARAAAKVGHLAGVRYAVPDYIAHTAGDFYPDDPGRSSKIHGWEKVQWNFLAKNGVNAPRRGSTCWRTTVRAPGAWSSRWSTPAWRSATGAPSSAHPTSTAPGSPRPATWSLGSIRNGRCTDPYALDRESHGTFVAGEIAEATNNNYGLTGLAYQATIMPVRVLDARGQRRLIDDRRRHSLCRRSRRPGDQPQHRVLSRNDQRPDPGRRLRDHLRPQPWRRRRRRGRQR